MTATRPRLLLLLALLPLCRAQDWTTVDSQSLVTDGISPYVFFPVQRERLMFSVRAASDVRVALSQKSRLGEPSIEVFLGTSANTRAEIRENGVTRVSVAAPGLLSRAEPRLFWITWSWGDVSVGSHGNSEPIISWRSEDPDEFEFIGFATGMGSTGDWVIENVGEFVETRYTYFPLSAIDSMTFKLLRQRTASIILTSKPSPANPKIEVIFDRRNGYAISRDGVRSGQAEIVGEFSDDDSLLRLDWSNESVWLGRDGEPPFLTWRGSLNFPITHVGLSRGRHSWITYGVEPSRGVVTQGMSDRFWFPETDLERPRRRCMVGSGYEAAILRVLPLGRTRHDAGWIPGRLWLANNNIYTSWNGREYIKPIHEVLFNCDVKWVNVTGGLLPSNAFPVGAGPTGETVFPCRAFPAGLNVHVVGRALRSERACKLFWISEQTFTTFETLVLPNA